MRPDREYVPFFGCMPHTPDRAYPELVAHATTYGYTPRPQCPTCGGVQPEGSPFVCMGCHAVAPESEPVFDKVRKVSILTGEPERNRARRSVEDALEFTNRSLLTAEERRAIVEEHGQAGREWLDAIGQPAPLEAVA